MLFRSVGAVAGALGERALAHVADVSLVADVQGIVDRALDVWGRIDVVVNNAGYGVSGAIEELSEEQARRANRGQPLRSALGHAGRAAYPARTALRVDRSSLLNRWAGCVSAHGHLPREQMGS